MKRIALAFVVFVAGCVDTAAMSGPCVLDEPAPGFALPVGNTVHVAAPGCDVVWVRSGDAAWARLAAQDGEVAFTPAAAGELCFRVDATIASSASSTDVCGVVAESL